MLAGNSKIDAYRTKRDAPVVAVSRNSIGPLGLTANRPTAQGFSGLSQGCPRAPKGLRECVFEFLLVQIPWVFPTV